MSISVDFVKSINTAGDSEAIQVMNDIKWNLASCRAAYPCMELSNSEFCRLRLWQSGEEQSWAGSILSVFYHFKWSIAMLLLFNSLYLPTFKEFLKEFSLHTLNTPPNDVVIFCLSHKMWFKKHMRRIVYCICYYICTPIFTLSKVLFWSSKTSFIILFVFNFISHSSRVDLPLANSLSFPSHKNVFSSLSSLKDIFVRYKIHDWLFLKQCCISFFWPNCFRWEIIDSN